MLQMLKRTGIALVVLLATTFNAVAEETFRIEVSGQGVVDARPDMVVLRLGVTEEARDAKTAMAAVSRDMAKTLEIIAAAGVAEEDIQTTGLRLNPVWNHQNNQRPRITGFSASNGVSVRLRDLEAVPGLLDAVLQAGITDLSGMRFALQDPEPQEVEARKRAVQDARAKAETLAEAAGVSLGRLVRLVEHGAPRAATMEMATMSRGAMAADVPIAAGELSVQVNVAAIYEIKE